MARRALLLSVLLLAACNHAPRPSLLPPTTAPSPLATAKRHFYDAVAGNKSSLQPALAHFRQAHAANPADPQLTAYLGASIALSATHTAWPPDMLARTKEGLALLDRAVDQSPDDLEIRFLRAMTNYNIPAIANRRPLAAADLAYIAPRAAQAVRTNTFPPELAAAALYHHAQLRRSAADPAGYRAALHAAAQISPTSPAGKTAATELARAQK